jgi:hypothetical protein
MMTLVSKEQAVVICDEIEQAVKEILAKHKMEIAKVRRKYGNALVFNLEASPINLNANGVNSGSIIAQTFLQYGKDYGFANPEEALGKTFKTKGRTFKLVGMNLNKSKFPVEAIDIATGESFGFTLFALKKIEGFDLDCVPSWMQSSFEVGA